MIDSTETALTKIKAERSAAVSDRNAAVSGRGKSRGGEFLAGTQPAPPHSGALTLIVSDIRAWAKLWEPRAAIAPRLPAQTIFHLVFQHPGLRATIVYRISHGLWQARIPILPGMFQRLNLFWHGFDFPALVSVGPGLYVPHPVGITVMAKSIGSNVTLVGSITIGMRNELAFPTIGDGVMVGAGARILGGITIGENAKIGANAVVLKDVPPGATAIGVPAVIKMPERMKD